MIYINDQDKINKIPDRIINFSNKFNIFLIEFNNINTFNQKNLHLLYILHNILIKKQIKFQKIHKNKNIKIRDREVSGLGSNEEYQMEQYNSINVHCLRRTCSG